MVSLLVFELDIWFQFGKGSKKRKIKEKTSPAKTNKQWSSKIEGRCIERKNILFVFLQIPNHTKLFSQYFFFHEPSSFRDFVWLNYSCIDCLVTLMMR